MERLYLSAIQPLEASQLANWVLGDAHDFLIIDVRDSDYRYGRIKGSIHIPSKQFDNRAIDHLLRQYPLERYSYIFHCMRSQIRGPACARKFVRYLCLNTIIKDDLSLMPKVMLLTGGLKRWNQLYGDDSQLMEEIT